MKLWGPLPFNAKSWSELLLGEEEMIPELHPF